MATDPKLSVSEINKIAQQEFEIGNKVFFFEVDPDNPFNRQLMVQDNLGLSDPVPVKLAAVQAEIAKQTHRGISNTNKID